MAILNNISVVEGDVRKIYPQLETLLFDDPEFNLDDVILKAKTEVYGILKEEYKELNPSYTDAETETVLDDIKDLTEGYLKDKVIHITIRMLMTQNDNYDGVEVYSNLADRIPLVYYIDSDADATVAQDEETRTQDSPTFHR